MNRLKFLQISVLGLALSTALGGCAMGPGVASPTAAEQHAVALANEKCEHEYGQRPFRMGRFPASRTGDRWLWGWLDVSAGAGFTAQVSFHADGSHPEVTLYFNENSSANQAASPSSPMDMEEPGAPSLGQAPEPAD
jgi:hypothetical protein